MGKVTRDVASDTSIDEQRKTVRKEQKTRTKKKKRKRDLTDLHRRLFKSKKQNRVTCKFWQSSFVKLLQRFADIRDEYDNETKIDGKLGKARTSKKAPNRILPRPLAGIYRNGAAGKEIRRSQKKLPLNDLNNARLQSNVLKLLDGYDSKSEAIVIKNDKNEILNDSILFDTTIKNVQPSSDHLYISPVLGKVDGKKRCEKEERLKHLKPECIKFPQKLLEKKKTIDSENLRNSALSKYEELCRIICSENFEGQNFPNCFTTDPLTTVKKKLRSIYAESFRSQFLRDMIKRGNILNECDTPSTSVENHLPNTEYCPPKYTQDTDLTSVTLHNPNRHFDHKSNRKDDDLKGRQNSLLIPETNFNLNCKKYGIDTSNFLFDLSLLNTSNAKKKNILESEITDAARNITSEDDSTEVNTHTSLEVNYSTPSVYSNNSIIKHFETNEIGRMKEENPFLFVSRETDFQNEPTDMKHMLKHKNRHGQQIQPLNSESNKYSEKQNSKMLQQYKMKNLKHMPAILRRCNNAVTNNNSRLHLFQEPMHINKEPREMLFDVAPKQNVLFTSQSLKTKLNENSKRLQRSNTISTLFDTGEMKDLNVQTSVMESPNVCDDEVYFTKSSYSQPVESKQQPQNLHVNDIFVNKKNPPVQKTVMFTKKDSRNIGHCLYLNNLISDGTADNSNVCIIRKNVPSQGEKSKKNTCAVHKNCQRVPVNSHRTFQCSQNCKDSNDGGQEFKKTSASQIQNIQMHQKPIVCEKVLVRKVQQQSKCRNNQNCHSDPHVCYVMVDQCKDFNNMQECHYNNISQIEKSRMLQNRRPRQEDIADIGILKGVQNMKILPMEGRESQIKYTDNQCIENTVILEKQPIKYLAYENNSKTQKIPIYMQENKHVASVDNVEIINPNANYRVVSYPQESTQKIIFVPTCEQNEIVYVKQEDLPRSNIAFEECSRPRKVVLYRPEVQCVKDSPNTCEIHIPKHNVIEIKENDCDTIVTNLKMDNTKKSRHGVVNWEELHYRPNNEQDAYIGTQAIYYQK
ncbi:PREDICTED: uncharacterized protein LOC108545417 [Eufriesea mexicana]|uniref:uncharacterized protein LOC108545417 n=1 Tax=Eufriesea mexicana TaxID=516756 RepID=UPI00083BB7C9|nr:PREDICTED: uncharacterized protein LOC108545417 [Eufriesea mexicana]